MTQAIKGLYTAFERYKRPAEMNHSPLAPGINIYRAITRSPLREIPHEYISAYAARAMTTLGNVDDFRHFLPRILELLADNLDQEMDPEEALSKLAYGKWKQWPSDEQEAIRQYLQALWILKSAKDRPGDPPLAPVTLAGGSVLRVLLKSQNELEIDTWLCAIAQAEEDLAPYLATVKIQLTPSSAWWKERPIQKQQVINFTERQQQ